MNEQRYARQTLFAGVGPAGQRRLGEAKVALVGSGALGSVLADLLVRAGVGWLRVIDRDFVELSNLQRQTLFDEGDARQSLPKAAAAERHLRERNSEVRVEGVVADLTAHNASELLSGFGLVLDGSDNFQTRLLVNDFSVKNGVAWIYCAALAAYGVTLTVVPGETACLACLLEDPAPVVAGGTWGAGTDTWAGETCDTSGILAPAASAIASLAAAQAMKFLCGKYDPSQARLISLDVWNGRWAAAQVARRPGCRACGRGDFQHLERRATSPVTLCGRDAVQIPAVLAPAGGPGAPRLDLATLGRRLGRVASEVHHNDFLLRFRVSGYDVTVFADGRAIIKGTEDPAVARSVYARYVGA